MKRIQDHDPLYTLLRRYVDMTFDMAYRRVEYYGHERIPTDGAVIFAPNHSNALMDALAILIIKKSQTVFVARADIFRVKTLAKILNFLKIMPINRIRDGYKNLSKNDEIMTKAVEVLGDKVPFCIMAEGTHRDKHALLPLTKGIFRIALRAEEELDGKMPVYIVPVGIEFGSYYRYRSSLLVQIGEPINITDFVHQNSSLEQPELMLKMRDLLSVAMQQNILHIREDEWYDATLQLSSIWNEQERDVLGLKKHTLQNRLIASQSVVDKIEHAMDSGTISETLLQDANYFAAQRKRAKIGIESFFVSCLPCSVVVKALIALVALPYFIFAALLTSPIWGLSEWLRSKMKDEAFNNSLRYVCSLVLLPLVWLILTIVLFSTTTWGIALTVSLAALPMNIAFHAYLRMCRRALSDFRLLRNRPLRNVYNNLKSQFIK